MPDLNELLKRRVDLAEALTEQERRCRGLRDEIAEIDERIEKLRRPLGERHAQNQQRLYQHLWQLRDRFASEEGVGPFSVFNDDALAEIANQQPLTELALYRIKGISAKRVQQHGDKIVDCVIRTVDPSRPAPDRPYFPSCPICGEMQVLPSRPPDDFRCPRCAKSTDPRLVRGKLTVKLPTAKDFDLQ